MWFRYRMNRQFSLSWRLEGALLGAAGSLDVGNGGLDKVLFSSVLVRVENVFDEYEKTSYLALRTSVIMISGVLNCLLSWNDTFRKKLTPDGSPREAHLRAVMLFWWCQRRPHLPDSVWLLIMKFHYGWLTGHLGIWY